MNINEFLECLTKLNINLQAKDICEHRGMDDTSFSRKKAGTEIKQKNILQLENKYHISDRVMIWKQ